VVEIWVLHLKSCISDNSGAPKLQIGTRLDRGRGKSFSSFATPISRSDGTKLVDIRQIGT
jgi:hypothetical protein